MFQRLTFGWPARTVTISITQSKTNTLNGARNVFSNLSVDYERQSKFEDR